MRSQNLEENYETKTPKVIIPSVRCKECGALVLEEDTAQHDHWHVRLEIAANEHQPL